MSKKTQALSSLAALAVCITSSQLMGAAVPEESFVEQDYCINVGGAISSTHISSFSSTIGEATFNSLCRGSSFGLVGITAFDRFTVEGRLGTTSLFGTVFMPVTAPASSTSFSVQSDSALMFGLAARGTFYQEGLVSASIFGEYEQSSVNISNASGFVDMTRFTLVPLANADGTKAGQVLIPTANESAYSIPSTATKDYVVLSVPHVAMSPKCSVDFYKYDIGGKLAYGQQVAVFFGLKYTYSGITLNCDERNVTSLAGEALSGTLIDSFLGTVSGSTKITSSLSSNFAPILGFTINSKSAQVTFCSSFLAEQSYKVQASVCF